MPKRVEVNVPEHVPSPEDPISPGINVRMVIDYLEEAKRQGKPFTPAEMDMAIVLLGASEKGIENLMLEARTDPLTGLYNRRMFDEQATFRAREIHRDLHDPEKRKAKPLSVLVIDLNDFKIVNDTLGHDAGDESLKLVSKSIKSVLQRGIEIPARVGGDEFYILLPDTDAAGAREVGKRMIEAVRTGQNVGTVTLSVGYATYNPDKEIDDMIRDADVAMYTAKQNKSGVIGGRILSYEEALKTIASGQ